jgi:Sep15/SelM redox domain
LNKLPELKAFLLNGEAESYEGVMIEYIHGRTAVMTIYEDDVEKEKVQLHNIQSRREMHELMRQKGFVQKATTKPKETKAPKKGDVRLIKDKKEKEERLLKREEQMGQTREDLEKTGHKVPITLPNSSAPYQTMFRLYILAGVSAAVLAGVARGRRLKRKRNGNPSIMAATAAS